jgi:hypothetical protein
MPPSSKNRARNDVAYVCFLIPGLFALFSTIGPMITSDPGVAGVVGLLVLVPLALAAAVAIPVGIILTFVGGREPMLFLLSVLTSVAVVELVGEFGGAIVLNAFFGLYGVLVVVLAAAWFLVRRKSFQ